MARVAAGAMFEVVEGGVGDLLVVQGRTGMVARRKPTYRRPTSPGQAAQAGRMERAGAFWNAISDDDALEWGRWAGTITKVASVGGRRYSPTGYNAFMELTLRAVQASPSLVPPSRPPVGPFLGDSTIVDLRLSIDDFGNRVSEVEGVLRFTASQPNAEGCAVEILVQRLVSARRKPGRQYKSMAFVRFEAGALSFDLPVASGAYACAARTLDPITGQAMGMELLGVVTVA